MKSMEAQRLTVLRSALETVEYKIKNLQDFYSHLQVRAWRKNRKNLKSQIRFLEGILAVKENQEKIKQILS